MPDLNRTKKVAAKRAKQVRTLCSWLEYQGLWRLPLKDGEIIVFSDNESTVLTYYVKWGARKLGSLRSAASRFGFVVQCDCLNAGQPKHLYFQVFAYFRNRLTKPQIANLILGSNPLLPLEPQQEMDAKSEFEICVKVDL